MNKQILDYLNQNKAGHERSALEAALLKSGYKPLEIEEAVEQAYGLSAEAPGDASKAGPFDFWDFRARVEYASKGQRRKDFWFGLGAPFLLSLAFSAILKVFSLLGLPEWLAGIFSGIRIVLGLAFFIAIFYLWNRRRSISYGIIAGYILSFIAGLALLAFVFALASASF